MNMSVEKQTVQTERESVSSAHLPAKSGSFKKMETRREESSYLTTVSVKSLASTKASQQKEESGSSTKVSMKSDSHKKVAPQREESDLSTTTLVQNDFADKVAHQIAKNGCSTNLHSTFETTSSKILTNDECSQTASPDLNDLSNELPSTQMSPVLNNLSQEVPAELRARFRHLTQFVSSLSSSSGLTALNGRPEAPLFIVVFDDNMYYASMRYKVYKLARHYRTGFVQIYFPVDVNVAMDRNERRGIDSGRVPRRVIETMYERFERPCPSDNSWEARTVVMENCEGDLACSLALSTIQDAVEHPPPQMLNDSDQLAAVELSRNICLASLVHRVDTILRKLIGVRVTAFKESGPVTKTELSMRAQELNARRLDILNDLRTGTLILPRFNYSSATNEHKVGSDDTAELSIATSLLDKCQNNENLTITECQLTDYLDKLLKNE